MATTDYGIAKVIRHLNTGILLAKYQEFFTTKEDYNFYIESYKWRLDESEIVQAFSCRPIHSENYCGGTYGLEIYIEHPKNRLVDFKDIPHPDNLYCLTALLKGYRKLFNNIGVFPVSEEQVCIDDSGFITVWINK